MKRSPVVYALLAFSSPLLAQEVDPPADPTGTGAEWWRGEVCYEVFVRSFYDSDGDGIGDLRGLIEKLDYINDGDPSSDSDLGVGCIWLMPIAQSTSYHGYDVTDYYAVDRDYGTKQDFEALVAEAHRRGIRIVVDLVLNHTSSEHPYFREALLDPGSVYRDWYLWASEPREMPGWEAPTWHRSPYRDEYYYGLFWSGMPDLNLANDQVRGETRRIARFWLEEMGVDGFRLDAVGHFFEEGGQWRHAPAVHPWLRDFAADLHRIDYTAYTVGEVYDSIGPTLPYYPDQLDAYFLFELGDAMIDAARTGSKAALVATMERVQAVLPRGRWATLLRNHDQTRTMTEMGGNAARARIAATLLLTLPGTPFVYYGEEIGMTGSKSRGDPRLRTPMHWSLEPAVGFTTGVPWEPLHEDSLTANVQVMAEDSASLLHHYRRLIHLRRAHPALATGDFAALATGSDTALAFLRRTRDHTALVLANLGPVPLSGLRVSSSGPILPPGRYAVTPILGPGTEAVLRVDDAGRLRPSGTTVSLEPFECRILLLSVLD
jgi:alpha-amylase